MLSPRYLDGLSDEITEIYSQLETDVLQDMARRLARLGKITDMTKWQAQMLAEAGGLKKNIGRILAKYDKAIVRQIKDTFTEALETNARNDNRIFKEATGRTVSAPNAQQMLSTIQKCHSDLARLTLTTAATTETQFVQQANRVYMQTQSGAFDYDTAMKTAADELSKRGITTVHYENGRPVTRSIESAVRMNILTSINQTAANQTLSNAEELGVEKFEVTAHIGARPEHEAWQGKIYTKSQLETICGLGDAAGLCGINCRHSFYPYFEGMEEHYSQNDLDEMADEKVSYNERDMTSYEGEQKLRGIERNIRHYKRQALTQEAAGVDNTKARRKLGEWQAAARDFTRQTGIARDSAREYVGTSGKQPTGLKPKKNVVIEPSKIKAEYNDILKKYNGDTNAVIKKATKSELTTVKAYNQIINDKKSEDYIKLFNAQSVDTNALTETLQKTTNVEQRDAFREWTSSAYRPINAYYRSGTPTDAGYKKTGQIIHDYLNKCEYPEMYVRRGADYEYVTKIFGSDEWKKNPQLLLHSELTDKGFLATTPSKTGGFSGEVMLYYKVPDKSKAAYIASLSYYGHEQETLFIDNTKAIIKEIRVETLGGHTRYTLFLDMEK